VIGQIQQIFKFKLQNIKILHNHTILIWNLDI
jgi:hypothetical protein